MRDDRLLICFRVKLAAISTKFQVQRLPLVNQADRRTPACCDKRALCHRCYIFPFCPSASAFPTDTEMQWQALAKSAHGFRALHAEIIQLFRDKKCACDLCTFILAEFDDGICGRYMGVVAVFYLTENLFTGQLNDHIDLFLIYLCLSEVAELRRAAPDRRIRYAYIPSFPPSPQALAHPKERRLSLERRCVWRRRQWYIFGLPFKAPLLPTSIGFDR